MVKVVKNKWKNSKMLVNLCFYVGFLKPIMQLSLTFKKKKINTVSATITLGKVKQKLLKLKNKDANN